jgi:hypothetical protein
MVLGVWENCSLIMSRKRGTHFLKVRKLINVRRTDIPAKIIGQRLSEEYAR